jgi:hypothetical protein
MLRLFMVVFLGIRDRWLPMRTDAVIPSSQIGYPHKECGDYSEPAARDQE